MHQDQVVKADEDDGVGSALGLQAGDGAPHQWLTELALAHFTANCAMQVINGFPFAAQWPRPVEWDGMSHYHSLCDLLDLHMPRSGHEAQVQRLEMGFINSQSSTSRADAKPGFYHIVLSPGDHFSFANCSGLDWFKSLSPMVLKMLLNHH